MSEVRRDALKSDVPRERTASAAVTASDTNEDTSCLGMCKSDHQFSEAAFGMVREMQTILEPQSLARANLQELMREMLVRLGEDPERAGVRILPHA